MKYSLSFTWIKYGKSNLNFLKAALETLVSAYPNRAGKCFLYL